MTEERVVVRAWSSRPTMEGAGVRLNRVFGFHEVPDLDPFLLLDHFGSDDPNDYLAGFPWHPHRGIETITYMIKGEVEHEDSLGNKGVIESGDVQWMTAGSGIEHQEMPHRTEGRMMGFQLWANLPASHKMMDPRYRDITKDDIPVVALENGVNVKVIAGVVEGIKGPVQDIVTDPEYLDVSMPESSEFIHSVTKGHNVFAYVFEGSGFFDHSKKSELTTGAIAHYGDGDVIRVMSGDSPVRFLLVSGKPIQEPVAWRGPIVMNTQEELRVAFSEYRSGTFIKKK